MYFDNTLKYLHYTPYVAPQMKCYQQKLIGAVYTGSMILREVSIADDHNASRPSVLLCQLETSDSMLPCY